MSLGILTSVSGEASLPAIGLIFMALSYRSWVPDFMVFVACRLLPIRYYKYGVLSQLTLHPKSWLAADGVLITSSFSLLNMDMRALCRSVRINSGWEVDRFVPGAVQEGGRRLVIAIAATPRLS